MQKRKKKEEIKMVHKKKIKHKKGQQGGYEEQKDMANMKQNKMAEISAVWVRVLQKNGNHRSYIYKELY